MRLSYLPARSSGWIPRTAAETAAPRIRPRRVNAIFCSDQAGNSEEPSRPRVRRTWAWVPAFGDRIGVGMKSPHDDTTGTERWSVQVQVRNTTGRRPHRRDRTCARFKINPSALFMPTTDIRRQGVQPCFFEGTNHGRIVEEVRACWCRHSGALLIVPHPLYLTAERIPRNSRMNLVFSYATGWEHRTIKVFTDFASGVSP